MNLCILYNRLKKFFPDAKNKGKTFTTTAKPSSGDIDRKNQSMKDSQGKSDFSGSSYNGPGNVDHEKKNSNMGQRNF